MRAEHVNPFIQSFSYIFKNVAGLDVVMGKAFIRSNPIIIGEISIIVGVTGDLRGQVVVSMSTETALKLASRMMMGIEVLTLDEISKSALSEIGNMILGNSATGLYNLNIKIDITPPNIITGKSMELSSSLKKNITIPFESDIGKIDFDISLKYKDN